MKYAVAGLGASAALAVIALNYQAPEGTQLFANEIMTADDYEFIKFVASHGKSYGTRAEFEFRNAQFKNTLRKIEEHNAEPRHKSKVAINFMADWTHEEYKRLLGYKGPQEPKTNGVDLPTEGIPASVDWRGKAVTNVKNQGQCGSCWSFSAAAAIEGAMALSGNTLQSFATQQLVDCDKVDQACNGGLMDNAFDYVEGHPLMLWDDYGYTARGGSCKYVKSKGVGKVKSYTDVNQDSTGDNLKAAVAKKPVAIAVEADQSVFQLYSEGVVTHGCGTRLDHGVTAVGYGTLEGQEFFLVKNSWGPGWGDQGYLRIAPNQCGITHQPSYVNE